MTITKHEGTVLRLVIEALNSAGCCGPYVGILTGMLASAKIEGN